MKKIIFMSLCVLLLAGTSAFGYFVEGRVLDESGNGVSGATVTIDCYPSSGSGVSSHHDTDTSTDTGFYTGGWAATNCKDKKMVVKATKGNKSGTETWTAGAADIVKNVTISQPPFATAELHCEAEPMAMAEPSTTADSSVCLYLQLFYDDSVLVNGGSTTMHYETETMSCTSVYSIPPFDDYFYSTIDPCTGTIDVDAYASGYVDVPNGVTPLPFFSIEFEAQDFNLPGMVSYLRLTSSEIEAMVGSEPCMISAFPSQTEIILGEPKCEPHFRITSFDEWDEALSSEWPKPSVAPMLESEWNNYMDQWNDPDNETEGEVYPDNEFRPAKLWVYEGGGEHQGYNYPNEPGLVMAWGDPCGPEPAKPNCASAWRYDYGMDPDLRNSTIKVDV